MLALLLLQAVDATGFEQAVWGRFERGGALRGSNEQVAIDATRAGAGRPILYRLRLTTRDALTGRASTHWSDSRACPAALAVVERFAALPMPAPDPPRAEPPSRSGTVTIHPPIQDGMFYSVTLPVTYGRGSHPVPVTLSSNIRTPLAHWVEGSFAELRPCWPDAPQYPDPETPRADGAGGRPAVPGAPRRVPTSLRR